MNIKTIWQNCKCIYRILLCTRKVIFRAVTICIPQKMLKCGLWVPLQNYMIGLTVIRPFETAVQELQESLRTECPFFKGNQARLYSFFEHNKIQPFPDWLKSVNIFQVIKDFCVTLFGLNYCCSWVSISFLNMPYKKCLYLLLLAVTKEKIWQSHTHCSNVYI